MAPYVVARRTDRAQTLRHISESIRSMCQPRRSVKCRWESSGSRVVSAGARNGREGSPLRAPGFRYPSCQRGCRRFSGRKVISLALARVPVSETVFFDAPIFIEAAWECRRLLNRCAATTARLMVQCLMDASICLKHASWYVELTRPMITEPSNGYWGRSAQF